MLRKFSLFTVIALFLNCTFLFGQTLPDKVIDVGNTICPITGEKVADGITLLHEGKLYHFCCPACIEKFKKDPAAAIARIKDAKDTTLTTTNTDGKCPVTGELAKIDIYLVRGDKITFYSSEEAKQKDSLSATDAKPANSKSSTPASNDQSASQVQQNNSSVPSAQGGASCGSSGDCSSCGACPVGGE